MSEQEMKRSGRKNNMTQYDERVQFQRDKLDAERWAKTPKCVHIHRLTSLWYETEESAKDLKDGNVTDIQYNSGRIERKRNGKTIRTFGEDLKGKALVYEYHRSQQR